ncbi:dicarboxylate/amino acid:cation symporter [Bacterioplanoides sp. SCSIO 12839]|uniref:dicarboxylate/amino acid:cation symporter n=1 Tax=Bacterioplanoides sp. SCSIO 12839 TaxID=2829569 RepID=UPI002108402C|nr:dicarboxylate/amino acid:cation symporter [Bacterioplanoides sp. SCSIO 12839]UTW48315.1 dicarboxylate/amino acid:cation symporter [Bacterioplanoides sp. SCSIO 12839]
MKLFNKDVPDSYAGEGVKHLTKLIQRQLWMQILLALVLGVFFGSWLSPEGGRAVQAETAYSIAEWVKLPGTIFLNMIQMVVIPLVLSSIMLGVGGGGDASNLKSVGLKIAPYFVLTTTLAVTIGITLALLIQPGNYVDVDALMANTNTTIPATMAPASDISIPQRLSALIPTNITRAIYEQSMLQLVIFAILMGLAMASVPRKRVAALRDMVEGVQEISMKVVGWAMLLAPYAVFGLLSEISIKVGLEVLLGMSAYVGTVLLGLFCLYLTYLIIVKLFAQRPVLAFAKAVRPAQLLAFSTSSSAAVMPLSLQIAQDELNVDDSTAKFVVPLGATVNMDGTALYQVIAAVFLAQVFGVDLQIHEILLLAITTVGASIGSPSTPGVGIVILATVLNSIGVPAEGIALILGVDRILDMCRTSVNVTGDLVACTVMQRWA